MYLLFIIVVVIILQAAGGLGLVREGGTLRVVLRAPEAIFPQFITFCKTDKQKQQTCYMGNKEIKKYNSTDLLNVSVA